MGWTGYSEEEYEMIGQDDLPDFPTPIVVTDRRGRAKWTVFIPPAYDFPLDMREYEDMMRKCSEVSGRVHTLHSHGHIGIDHINLVGGGGESSSSVRHFVDVNEAERLGFLPGVLAQGRDNDQPGQDKVLLGVDANSLIEKPVCETSMTYVLESEDAGLGKTLMTLWMAYGLAKQEGRAFFIDDTRWAYGAYTGLFEPPPIPDCLPPPRHEILPCPRQARHLIVSAINAKEILGSTIDVDFEEGGQSLQRPEHQALYQMARQGYQDLYHLIPEDRDYVFNRVKENKMKAFASQGVAHTGKIVGVHVRRGDRHPFEFQYADSYIPLNVYAERAREIINATFDGRGPDGGEDRIGKDHSFLVLASDDPVVYESEEFRGATRAQEQIRLAGKEQTDRGDIDKSVMHKFVDESLGWEGGFFAAMFWHLGLSSMSAANAAKLPETRLPPSSETIRLRSLVGRAYLMDLSVLAELSDSVVCTVSSMGCRMMAVMMGYKRAFDAGQWVNVDGEYGWSGSIW